MTGQEIKYDKVLVARHNPENKCFAEGGAILILKPKKLKKDKGDVGHHFLDCKLPRKLGRLVDKRRKPTNSDDKKTEKTNGLHSADSLDTVEKVVQD
jgi:hypothetical protein